MVELESFEHKLMKDPFWADHGIFFGFGANKYNGGYTMVKKKPDEIWTDLDQVVAKVEQGVKDLITCLDDIKSI